MPIRPRLVKATTKIQRLFWTFNGVLISAFWLLFLLIHDSYGRGILTAAIVTGISAGSLSLLLTSAAMRRYFLPSDQARAARVLKREIAHEISHQQTNP